LSSSPLDPDESDFRAQVERDLRRNYTAHLFHGLLGQTGFRLVQLPTFIPAYLFMLSGSELVVGLAQGMQSFGQCLTPLFSAAAIEHRRRVMPVAFVIGGLMRVQILGIALSGFFLSAQGALIATCVFLLLFGFFQGMQGVVFGVILSKVIPVERRGMLVGLRNALAGLVTAAVAMVGGSWFVEQNVLGNGYAATFLVGFGLTALGLSMLAFIREPASPDVRARQSTFARLSQLPELLRGDRDFTAFFIARALATMGRMALPFYVIYASGKIHIAGFELGLLSAAFQISQTSTNLLWGLLADRMGFRLVFAASLAIWIGAVVLLMQTADLEMLVAVFIGIGAGMGGFQIASQNLVLEFGARRDLPLRIAVANASSELMGAIGPLAAGLLIVSFSYASVFWIAIAFKLSALVALLLFVQEPRRRLPT